MTEKELLEVAADRPPPPPDIFWSSNVYGMGKWLRRYVGYPDSLPLCAELDHGPHFGTAPHKMYLESQAPLMLFHSQRQVDAFRDFSAKPSAAMGSPFAYYRWMNGIRVARDAAGTLAFPVHSTHHVQSAFDWRAYCGELRRIPARFQPVTVSLYWKDILDGRHRIFQEEGFEVVSSGHMYDDRFAERFYRNLSRHRYVTSSELCTAGVYGLEMGLPYFLWGEQDYRHINTGGDGGLPPGEYRRRDLAGLFTLTPAALDGLQAAGMPRAIGERLAGLCGKKVLEEAAYRRLLEERLTGEEAALYLPSLLARAKAPMDIEAPGELFREPRETVTAEQKAFCHVQLGLNSARPRAELRELLLSALDTALLGAPGNALASACRRETDSPPTVRSAWGACPACGAIESWKDGLLDAVPDGYPPEVGQFALCDGCGTAFRGGFAAFPSRESLGPEPVPGSATAGWQDVAGLEEVPDPLAMLALAAAGETGLLIRVPGLAGRGLPACRGNAEVRTLFTVTGLRRLLARAGCRSLAVFQAPDGTLRAAARRADDPATRWGTAMAPMGLRERSRSLLLRSGPQSVPAEVAGLLDRIVAVASGASLGRAEKGICLAKLLDLVRRHPAAAEPCRAVADVQRAWGDPDAAGYWLGMYSESAGAGRFPAAALRDLPAAAGIPLALFGEAADAPPPGDALITVLELLNAERFGDALAAAETALGAERRNPDLRFARAIALARLERVPEAVAALADLVASHPGYHGAGDLLSRLAPDGAAG